MRTTAEGVETLDQQRSVLALGCDEAQGYLFSAPVPVEQVPEILASWAHKEPYKQAPKQEPKESLKQRTKAA
jgi:EAL domain-containing protein (putative c-di-GMP-specific phosphodiesterase class I)